MNRTSKIFTALLFPLLSLTVLLGAAGCGGSHETPAPHEGEAKEALVLRAPVAEALRQEIPTVVEVQGTVAAERSAAVSTRVMATVREVHVRTGDRVKAGQKLLSIDPQAAEGQVAQARGALAQAKAALSLAQRNYERYAALAAEEAASEAELDHARMQLEQARGAVEAAQGAVSAAGSIAGDARVTAPFDGRVARRMVEVGDLAAPGRPLLMVESEGGRRLVVAVPESLVAAAGLAVGSEVGVKLDTRADLGILAGRVVEMTPGADPSSHSYTAEIALPAGEPASSAAGPAATGPGSVAEDAGLASAPEPGGTQALAVPSGSAGRALLEAGRREAVTVPASAVLRHGGLELVVVDDGGRADSRAVTTGRQDGDRVEILSGLDGGERIVLGLEALPPAGARIEEIQSQAARHGIQPGMGSDGIQGQRAREGVESEALSEEMS